MTIAWDTSPYLLSLAISVVTLATPTRPQTSQLGLGEEGDDVWGVLQVPSIMAQPHFAM